MRNWIFFTKLLRFYLLYICKKIVMQDALLYLKLSLHYGLKLRNVLGLNIETKNTSFNL